jgi:hypothetical protein
MKIYFYLFIHFTNKNLSHNNFNKINIYFKSQLEIFFLYHCKTNTKSYIFYFYHPSLYRLGISPTSHPYISPVPLAGKPFI